MTGNTARGRMLSLLLCAALWYFLPCAPAAAAESQETQTHFDAVTAFKGEVHNIAGEGVTFLKAPVTQYLPATALTLGAFGITYVYDRDIRNKIESIKSGVLHSATDVGSFLGQPLLHLGVAGVVYGAGVVYDAPATVRLGQKMGEALLLADGATFFLKAAVGRARPSTGDDQGRFRPFSWKTDFDSLPSMHTASSFALAHVLAAETESVPVKALCYSTATFVGFSRMYQQKHWTSDVIISAAIGELAGRVVTNYHREGKSAGVMVVPMMSAEGAPLLALQGTFR